MPTTTPPLPAGAVANPREEEFVGDNDQPDPVNGIRWVEGPRHGGAGEFSVYAVAIQHASGHLVDSIHFGTDDVPGTHYPGLFAGIPDGQVLTPAKARAIARGLIDAADLAEAWIAESHPTPPTKIA